MVLLKKFFVILLTVFLIGITISQSYSEAVTYGDLIKKYEGFIADYEAKKIEFANLHAEGKLTDQAYNEYIAHCNERIEYYRGRIAELKNKKEDEPAPAEEEQKLAQEQEDLARLQATMDALKKASQDESDGGVVEKGETETAHNAAIGYIGGNNAVAYRISLGLLDNRDVEVGEGTDAMFNAVLDYGADYYVICNTIEQKSVSFNPNNLVLFPDVNNINYFLSMYPACISSFTTFMAVSGIY